MIDTTWLAAAIRAAYPRIGQEDALAYAESVQGAWDYPTLAIGMADSVPHWRDYYGAVFTLPHITGRHRELARDLAGPGCAASAAKALVALPEADYLPVLVCLYHAHSIARAVHLAARELGG